MANANITIHIKPLWYSHPPDGSFCEGCGELICSEVYRAMLQYGDVKDLNFRDVNFTICKSCHDIIKKRHAES